MLRATVGDISETSGSGFAAQNSEVALGGPPPFSYTKLPFSSDKSTEKNNFPLEGECPQPALNSRSRLTYKTRVRYTSGITAPEG